MAKKVLLIDDDPLQLTVREAVLRRAGLEIAIATNAESALALLRTLGKQVGAIVTDHILPGASGAEFVRRLRAIRPDIPVLVVSGLAEAEPEYKDLNVTFRQKPLDPPELISLVRQALERAA